MEQLRAAGLGTHKGCPYGEYGCMEQLRGAGVGTHKGCPYSGMAGWSFDER